MTSRPLVFLVAAAAAAALAVPATGSDYSRVDQLVHQYAPDATVVCELNMPANALGLTYMPDSRVELYSFACLGVLLYYSPRYVPVFRRANPGLFDTDRMVGVGIVATLHEAQHAAGVVSETVAECLAMRDAQRMLDTPRTAAAWRAAVLFDSSLPAVYHDGGC